MRVPIQWLSDYVDVSLPLKEVAHRLTMAGLEVTGVERTGSDWENVVVGAVIDVRPHPDADRLRLVTVDDGSSRHEVVCGAPNVARGQKIAYASIGASLRDAHTSEPRKLKKAKIRGVVSEGMVCSERELGLSDEHEGILVLAPDAVVGRALGEVLGDTVLVIDMKPNRADGLSVLGVARDVAALTGATVREPDLSFEAKGAPIEGRAGAAIEDPDLCARFTLALIEGIRIGPSPGWMQERLVAAGMRPINNVVDVTNYVMLELGQPIHAFDYDTIADHRILVRRARPGEKLTTLDGKERTFDGGQLLITDSSGPIAVAGVMGGLATEVTESTRNILLEVANFNQVSIRRTAAALKLPSEASRRFAWGIAPELAPLASRRATKLLVELASGTAAGGWVDAYPVKSELTTLSLTRRRVSQVLGIDPPIETITDCLERLGFEVSRDDAAVGTTVSVKVPYWRRDVQIPDDLVEEVARMIGYEQIPVTPLDGRIPPRVTQPERELRERVKDVLVGAGMQEIITYPLTSLEVLERVVPPEELAAVPPLAVVNPLNVGQERLRTSLRASVLEIVARNQRHGPAPLALFEAARVYLPTTSGLPDERERVVGAIAGSRLDRWGAPTGENCDFFDAKAYAQRVLDRLGVDVSYVATEEYGLLLGRSAEIRLREGETVVGVLGQVHPKTAESFGLVGDVFLFEIRLRELVPHASFVPRYRTVSKFPSVIEDLAVVVPVDASAGSLLEEIEGHPLVGSVRVFDEYQGEPVPEGKKSLAFEVAYQAPDRTLTDVDVAKARERILSRLTSRFGAELRG
jgi:phenylalanyl-tRNA synthetase beta chain